MIGLIGDIHGCIAPLQEVVAVASERCSALVFLGDYVDRGPSSKDVLEFLVQLQASADIETHFLRGNHDQEFLRVLDRGDVDNMLRMGGAPTIASYVPEPFGDIASQLREAVPSSHVGFLRQLATEYRREGITASHKLSSVPETSYQVVGHSLQHSLRPDVGLSVAYIDTGCGTLEGGRLTCLFWPERSVYQSVVTWSEA